MDEARSLVGDLAVVHPPIRRGDIESIVAGIARPGSLLLIDGVFYSCESVAVMEIRDAIRAGWRLYGASSMGALRAVEAGPLGMIGIGGVFRWLKLFEVEDDDEIAQVVDAATYLPLGLSMIDIRGIIHDAVRKQALSSQTGKTVIEKMKDLYFPDRTLARLSEYAGGALTFSTRLWKQRDARMAIQLVAGGHFARP